MHKMHAHENVKTAEQICIARTALQLLGEVGHACTERKHVHFLAIFSGKSTLKMSALKSSSSAPIVIYDLVLPTFARSKNGTDGCYST
eukprot:scaffold4795_cov191-Skeletonema_marinoi.AAC.7